jgi:hypothetical protein
LYGLQASNPVDPEAAYSGNANYWGNSCDNSNSDPLCGKRMGGINVFGGGLAIYDSNGVLKGALGVSGDTSCGMLRG